jgi:hypothetical protein
MELDETTVEKLAPIIHETHRATFEPDAPPWGELSEDLREANRDQARDIPAKLAAISARIERAPGQPTFTFTTAELECLARAEHERWATQRDGAGWRHGAIRSDHGRLHPMLVRWADLSEYERDKDREAVLRIPEIMARVGLRVVRAAPSQR